MVAHVIVAIKAACYLSASLILYVCVTVVFPYNLMLDCCKKKMRPAFTHSQRRTIHSMLPGTRFGCGQTITKITN